MVILQYYAIKYHSRGWFCFKAHDGLHLFLGCATLSVPTMHRTLNISHYWNVLLLFGTCSEGLVYPEAKLFEERLVKLSIGQPGKMTNTTCQGFHNKLELNI